MQEEPAAGFCLIYVGFLRELDGNVFEGVVGSFDLF